ncbi:MAG: erythromycin esterase [Labilithrix sp.]|nr:erythromycin esterase [Labilithrix sp.]
MASRAPRLRFEEPASPSADHLAGLVRPFLRPLASDADLDPLLARIGDARIVLLGEATHGTSEFYEWRARLSRRLVQEKGFSFVAVEGDWPECERVNRYVKGEAGAGPSARETLGVFERWPSWMWANEEVARFIDWMRDHNGDRPAERRVGFYGLDVYSLWDSMKEVVGYLGRVDPAAAAEARRAYECFRPYGEDAERYAMRSRLVPSACTDEVVRALTEVRRAAAHGPDGSREGFFHAEQNAIVAMNAEAYYRAMVSGDAASWNVRDSHMVETLDRLLAFHGPGSKAIVWEHNSHVGDARYTDMTEDGEVNVGQLVRERRAHEGVVIVGASTHRGTVIAGDEWDAPMRVMNVPEARLGSWEDVLHRASEGGDRLVLFPEEARRGDLLVPRGHRAIGVVYHPGYERFGNYVPTVLPCRYDALLFVDASRALEPFRLDERARHDAPETFPSGM